MQTLVVAVLVAVSLLVVLRHVLRPFARKGASGGCGGCSGATGCAKPTGDGCSGGPAPVTEAVVRWQRRAGPAAEK